MYQKPDPTNKDGMLSLDAVSYHWYVYYPTIKSGMQNRGPVEMYILHIGLRLRSAPKLYAQLTLINEIWPNFCSQKAGGRLFGA